MGRTSITLEIPDVVYDNLCQIAERQQISPEALVQEWLDVLAGAPTGIPDEAALATFNDQELWAVISRLSFAGDRMRSLSEEAKGRSLSPEEQAELDQLITQYDTWVLVRSTALALLKKRGYDIHWHG